MSAASSSVVAWHSSSSAINDRDDLGPGGERQLCAARPVDVHGSALAEEGDVASFAADVDECLLDETAFADSDHPLGAEPYLGLPRVARADALGKGTAGDVEVWRATEHEPAHGDLILLSQHPAGEWRRRLNQSRVNATEDLLPEQCVLAIGQHMTHLTQVEADDVSVLDLGFVAARSIGCPRAQPYYLAKRKLVALAGDAVVDGCPDADGV